MRFWAKSTWNANIYHSQTGTKTQYMILILSVQQYKHADLHMLELVYWFLCRA